MTPPLGKPAPEFEGIAVVDGKFKTIKLSDYKGKYLVLLFYPHNFTEVCPMEIVTFSEADVLFEANKCELVAVSTDSRFTDLAWINTPRNKGGLGGTKTPLLADKSGEIARAYGVLNEDTGMSYRGQFIIDDKQRLRQITVHDFPSDCCCGETLRIVKVCQFTDAEGEVRPAN